MGQSESLNKITGGVDNFQEELVKHAKALTEITSITYEEFLEHLFHLNTLSERCMDSDGNQVLFAIKQGTNTTVFWKGTIRIAVIRRNIHNSTVVTCKLLTLNQFLKIVKTLDYMIDLSKSNSLPHQSDEVDEDGEGCSSVCQRPLTQSLLLDVVNNKGDISPSVLQGDDEKKSSCSDLSEACIICFERKPDIVLPCMHSFCQKCIDCWNVKHKTCPVCREEFSGNEDKWVISDRPGELELSEQIAATIMSVSTMESDDERSPSSSSGGMPRLLSEL